MMGKWSDVVAGVRAISGAEKQEIRLLDAIVAVIVKRREFLGWTQQQVAEKCGLTQTAIARLENQGAIPRMDTLIKVADALGLKVQLVPVEYLNSEQAATALIG